MIGKVKLTDEVTLVTEDCWINGYRIFEGRLRPPKKDYYDKEEVAIKFKGNKLIVDVNVLSKYGIKMEIKN